MLSAWLPPLIWDSMKNKQAFTATKEDDRILLEKLAMDGLCYRYGSRNKQAHERVLKELKIINDLTFNAYFLIAWDVLRYARDRRFFYVGRGSGANSIVAYCLQITDVDPGISVYRADEEAVAVGRKFFAGAYGRPCAGAAGVVCRGACSV